MSLRAIMLSVEIWCQQDNVTVLLTCWHYCKVKTTCQWYFGVFDRVPCPCHIIRRTQISDSAGFTKIDVRSPEVILRASQDLDTESGLERWNRSARSGRIPEATLAKSLLQARISSEVILPVLVKNETWKTSWITPGCATLWTRNTLPIWRRAGCTIKVWFQTRMNWLARRIWSAKTELTGESRTLE